ncbi:MAG: hypothetical protein U5L45_15995 [Saprospiraceae bacterium]|nr:hypothetical protein [Saprospiraceae bacterium]
MKTIRMKHADTVATYGFADFGFNILKMTSASPPPKRLYKAEHQHKQHVLMLVGGHSLIHTEGVQNIQNEAFTHLRYNYRFAQTLDF